MKIKTMMQNPCFRRRFLFILCLGAGMMGDGVISSLEAGGHHLKITDSWALPSLGQAQTAAVYAMITVQDTGDRLLKADTPVAGRAEIHTHIQTDGVMKMQSLDFLDIPPEGVLLAPGGGHIMLFGLKEPLLEGTQFPVTLSFAKAGETEIMVDVKWPDDTENAGKDAHSHGTPSHGNPSHGNPSHGANSPHIHSHTESHSPDPPP